MCEANSHTNKDSTNIPSISAEELHRIVKKALRVNHRSRHKLILALLALAVGKLYLKLGCSSIEQYAERYCGYGRTKTFESLRVAKALPGLPECSALFDRGELAWSALREISRVADRETEKTWIEFSREHTFRQLRLEVQDALKKGRPLPRKDGYGLPNLTCPMTFDLTLEEHNILQKALEKVAAEMRESFGEGCAGGGAPIDRKEAILYIAHKVLETELPDALENRREREEGIYDVVYRLCPGCRKHADVATPEGPVVVPVEHAKRIEGDARRTEIRPEEERKGTIANGELGKESDGGGEARGNEGAPKIDRPNPKALARKVKLRDGRRCANPGCLRVSGLHSHHVVYRWKSGRTEVWNELCVCVTCHALLHLGYLVIEERENGTFRWVRRSDGIDLGLGEEEKEVAAIPMLILRFEAAGSAMADGSIARSVGVGPAGAARRTIEERLSALVRAFQEAGVPGSRAAERVRNGYEKLREAGKLDPTDEELRQAALEAPASLCGPREPRRESAM